jgi:hypothetical protein
LEIEKASEYCDRIGLWRKAQIGKDPIAVGVLGEERFLRAGEWKS